MVLNRNNNKDEVEPYDEPDPENDEWPEEWTKRQKENWEDFGINVYSELQTDVGRYWYRRTWRPKKARDGMMQRDHVKLGTPEDYVAENVSDVLNPMGDITSVMMRQLSKYKVDTDELDNAVEDIVQARIANMDHFQKQRLVGDAVKVAELYGLNK